jgi:hypothetical protein
MTPNPAFETDAIQRCALHGAAQQVYKDFPGYCKKGDDDEGRTA